MNVYDAIMSRRTIRKYKQIPVEREKLMRLADCGRMAAFGANMQPLRFALVTKPEVVKSVFALTKWSGYVPEGAPTENEAPTAFIIVIGDTNLRKNGAFDTDAGAAVTNMMLAACEEGLSTCWLGAIDRDGIKKVLALPENENVVFALAVGYGAQESRPVEMKDGNVKYYLDENGNLCVPKRALEDIISEY